MITFKRNFSDDVIFYEKLRFQVSSRCVFKKLRFQKNDSKAIRAYEEIFEKGF